jgi:hypothetical protein
MFSGAMVCHMYIYIYIKNQVYPPFYRPFLFVEKLTQDHDTIY